MIKKIIIAVVIVINSFVLYGEYYSINEWYLVEKTDPITDDKEISIFIKKQEENSLNFNTLMIKIDKNSININLYTPSIVFKKRFNNEDKITIVYRLDKNEPRTNILNKYGETEFYSLSYDKEASSEKSIILLKELLSHNVLAVRAFENIDNVRHTYTYVYDLNRLKELILTANFDDTILENYKSEIESIIVNQQNNSDSQKQTDEIYNEGKQTDKTNHKENIYLIDDIKYDVI
ncbi:hypothetical protein [Brachyspira murdochii]|uniref:Uncharacterized protein n=1 Tax=Brachyspira murdochii (strain ATCC 51284 / DSM 12563 / 56-150) TaxID=526224 RepID=D5UAY6_BRAM5|nr:hypothetical protein [Brachyspira murdochii]ADG71859.1 conserved hypothetical protein [Brachyspira murdochii DSM 12563]